MSVFEKSPLNLIKKKRVINDLGNKSFCKYNFPF